MNKVIILLLSVVIALLICLYVHFTHIDHYYWFCQNTSEGRKGVSYTVDNCYLECDKYKKNAICCKFTKQCSKNDQVDEYFCDNERPTECHSNLDET